ncbi:MAG TPA: VWA domain-containing protein [Vicinamibacterales bacterium]|jgi:Mg-chelatase subunit ChlD|nr:VWA domain-containing protein [Vicinamibacterales bacterium]
MRPCAGALIALSFALTIPGPSTAAHAERTIAPQAPGTAVSKGPMRVALLVDTSDGVGTAITQIRAAVLAFADALPPEPELMLVTTGRRTQVRVPPTTDRKKVKDSASGITSDHGATPLMDALVEVDERFMRKAPDRWAAFVVITGDGSESSTSTDDRGFNKWLAALTTRQVSVDAIVLKFKGNGLPEAIATAAVRATNGRLDATTAVLSLPDKLKAIAERLAHDHAQSPDQP